MDRIIFLIQIIPMTKKVNKIRSYIEKYTLSKLEKDSLMNKLSYYKESIEMPNAKKFGDDIEPILELKYVYEDNQYSMLLTESIEGGDRMFSSNEKNDDIEDDEVHFNFREAIFEYIGRTYRYIKFKETEDMNDLP